MAGTINTFFGFYKANITAMMFHKTFAPHILYLLYNSLGAGYDSSKILKIHENS